MSPLIQWLDQHEELAALADAGSIGITVGALVGLLPTMSAALAVLWMGIRVYETATVQKLLGKKNDGES